MIYRLGSFHIKGIYLFVFSATYHADQIIGQIADGYRATQIDRGTITACPVGRQATSKLPVAGCGSVCNISLCRTLEVFVYVSTKHHGPDIIINVVVGYRTTGCEIAAVAGINTQGQAAGHLCTRFFRRIGNTAGSFNLSVHYE